MENSKSLSASWERWEFREFFTPYSKKLTGLANDERQTPALWDTCEGCILWLPSTLDRCESLSLPKLPEGVLGHPIVVLRVSVSGPEDAVVSFASMRSFKDNGPDESHHLFWDRYLKISTVQIQGGAALHGTARGKVGRRRGQNGNRYGSGNVPSLTAKTLF